MTDLELVNLDLKELTEESAKEIGLELLWEDVASDRAGMIRNGVASAVLLVIMLIVGMDTIPGYAVMGIAAVSLMRFFDKLQVFVKKKRMIRQFENDTYEDGYVAFVQQCQDFVNKRMKNRS